MELKDVKRSSTKLLVQSARIGASRSEHSSSAELRHLERKLAEAWDNISDLTKLLEMNKSAMRICLTDYQNSSIHKKLLDENELLLSALSKLLSKKQNYSYHSKCDQPGIEEFDQKLKLMQEGLGERFSKIMIEIMNLETSNIQLQGIILDLRDKLKRKIKNALDIEGLKFRQYDRYLNMINDDSLGFNSIKQNHLLFQSYKIITVLKEKCERLDIERNRLIKDNYNLVRELNLERSGIDSHFDDNEHNEDNNVNQQLEEESNMHENTYLEMDTEMFVETEDRDYLANKNQQGPMNFPLPLKIETLDLDKAMDMQKITTESMMKKNEVDYTKLEPDQLIRIIIDIQIDKDEAMDRLAEEANLRLLLEHESKNLHIMNKEVLRMNEFLTKALKRSESIRITAEKKLENLELQLAFVNEREGISEILESLINKLK